MNKSHAKKYLSFEYQTFSSTLWNKSQITPLKLLFAYNRETSVYKLVNSSFSDGKLWRPSCR